MIKPLNATHKRNIGDIVATMMVGHIVDVRITALTQDNFLGATYDVEFICHHDSGKDRLCLDFGQNWHIKYGDKETTEDRLIDRASEIFADRHANYKKGE